MGMVLAIRKRLEFNTPPRKISGSPPSSRWRKQTQYFRLGQHKQCVADCDAAIAKQPRYGKAFYRRAQAREALEQEREAEAIAQAA